MVVDNPGYELQNIAAGARDPKAAALRNTMRRIAEKSTRQSLLSQQGDYDKRFECSGSEVEVRFLRHHFHLHR